MKIGETSPLSAREAAMRAMKHETFLKHLESYLETSLKHSGNTLENHETPLKPPLIFLSHENFMKVRRKIEGCFEGILWVFQGSFKGAYGKFQGCFMKVSRKIKDVLKEF